MKKNLRVLPVLSSMFFWISLTTMSLPGIVMLSFLGIGIAIMIVKARPISQLSWRNPTLRWIVMLLSTLLSVIASISFARMFYRTWGSSSMLQGIVARLPFEMWAICVALGIGMFPFLFDVICRALYHGWEMMAHISFPSLWAYTKQTVTVKGTLKSTALVLLALLLSASIGLGLLTAVFCIPVDPIDKNVASSAVTIQKEGQYPHLSNWFFSQLDNWTDSIILLEAADASDTSALVAAISSFRGTIEGVVSPAETLVAHYVDQQPFTDSNEYSRYWHGYLVLIKPLLCIMDYNAIRVLNGTVQLLLVAIICLLMRKRGLKGAILPILLIYGMLMPVALACSIQFSNCFYVLALGLIGMLLIRPEKLDRYSGPLFLFLGIATAYFDFLTYPVATFGVPVLMLLLLQNSRPLEEKLFLIVKCGLFWCIGFGGMWVLKWVISQMLCGYSFSSVFSKIMERTSSSNEAQSISLLQVEAQNFTAFLTTPVTLPILLLIVMRYFKYQKQSIHGAQAYRAVLPYILIGCVPIVWYGFASNHSAIHYWFTNKSCAVTLLGILFALDHACLIPANRSDHP